MKALNLKAVMSGLGRKVLDRIPQALLSNVAVAQSVPLTEIKTAEPFVTLFPIRPTVLADIVRSMRADGFDRSQPLHVWKEGGVLIDGHTRLRAAQEAGLKQVWVYEHSFQYEGEAITYAVDTQKNRRNLTDAELFRCIIELDKRMAHGGVRGKSPGGLLNEAGNSRARTAGLVGTSASKVMKVRKIADGGDPGLVTAVQTGEVSINKAYESVINGPATKPKKAGADVMIPAVRVVDEFEAQGRFLVELDWLPDDLDSAKLVGQLVGWLESRYRVKVGGSR